MSADDPTPGELYRMMKDLANQIQGIVGRLERRDSYIEENFVRTQVWFEARKADQGMAANLHQDIGALKESKADQSALVNVAQDLETLQKERETERANDQAQRQADRNWRRQMTLTIALTAITTLLSIVGLVLTLVLSLTG
ncbi:hypothetical protein [Nocardioides sp.]|uniref:hypothetical protein n=1 Tax=Nocardioides sp. TaxID=35761 RepID=UPI00262665A1|nr:hypothetical protein [Nocardioides sp.]MDI6911492.1 hypothetical protein [Nocardioides sp.]